MLTSAMRYAMRKKSSATHMSFYWAGAVAARFQHFINRRPKTRPSRAVRVGRTGFDQARFYFRRTAYSDGGAYFAPRHADTQWIDASITDETDPERRDPAWISMAKISNHPTRKAFLERYRPRKLAQSQDYRLGEA